jgi:aspartate/methionine/tyrosine aminotransferase
MKIKPFTLERYFTKHEFSAPYLLSCSDAEPLTLPDLLTLAEADSLRLWEGLSLGYTDSQGHPELLAAIAQLYRGVGADQVIEVVPEEGIFITMHALLNPGDHVIVTHPGYQSLYQIAISIGCDVSWWEPHMRSDMSFDVDDVAGLITPRTKLIVVNFPHNPTGALPDRRSQARLIDLARARNIPIFSDEMYRYAELDPAHRLPSMVEMYEKGITLGGMSKSFSLPGLRVGWLVSLDTDFMEAVKVLKDYTTICAAAPSEILALIALRSMEKILARNLGIYQANLIELRSFFLNHAGRFRWIAPKAGTITFPELLGDLTADAFCEQLLDQTGVMLLPASVLGYPGNHVRIGFGRKDMPEVLARLDRFLLSF